MGKERRIEFVFVEREDGTTEVTAHGTAFKWGDLSAIVAFVLHIMKSKYGKENN